MSEEPPDVAGANPGTQPANLEPRYEDGVFMGYDPVSAEQAGTAAPENTEVTSIPVVEAAPELTDSEAANNSSEQNPVSEEEKKLQPGQHVKILRRGQFEKNWEVEDAFDRTHEGYVRVSLKSPDGSERLKLNQDLVENWQLAPDNTEEASASVESAREAALPAISEGAASAREVGSDMAVQVEELSRRMDEILPAQTINERFDNLSQQLNQRFEEISRRLQAMETEHGSTSVYPPSEAPTRVVAPVGAEDSNGQREIGDRIGSPGQAEVRGQNPDGQPYIYRKDENGQWEVSRNGNLANEWFPASVDDIMRDLGFGGGTGRALEAPQPIPIINESTPSPNIDRPEVPQSQPEQPPQEEVEEVDAEAMDAALAAAWAAMESGRSNYDEAKDQLRQAIDIWNGQHGGAGSGPTPPEGGPSGAAASATNAEVVNVRQERRNRLKRKGRRAIGALLVAGGLVGAFFLGKHFGADTDIIQKHIAGGGGKHAHEGAGKAIEHAGKFKTEELRYYGDTIWAHGRATLAQAMGGKLPKDWQVYQWCKETMSLPGNKEKILNSMGHWRSTWEGARHLPVGFHFRISEHITQLIARR